jgi:hypothetical protein
MFDNFLYQMLPRVGKAAPRRNGFEIRAVGVRSLTGLARGLAARGIRPHMQICSSRVAKRPWLALQQ